MFTSDTKQGRGPYRKTVTAYLIVTLFCALFGGVYEIFGHGVFSFPMLYAFAFPLAGGVTPFFFLMTHKIAYPPSFSAGSCHAGIATLTVGSLVTGALEIYGTTSPLLAAYWIVGTALLAVGVLSYLFLGLPADAAKNHNAI
ncbi:MAG: hypothetical protein IJP98_00850 [Clostridia bacterium]|nr:hypothetical protein [Clostridia bacterium]